MKKRKKISRQREWSKRMQRQGRCVTCGKPVFKGARCFDHYARHLEAQRQARVAKKRRAA